MFSVKTDFSSKKDYSLFLITHINVMLILLFVTTLKYFEKFGKFNLLFSEERVQISHTQD